MHAPQIIWLILAGLGLLLTRKTPQFWGQVGHYAIMAGLLFWGGFFGGPACGA